MYTECEAIDSNGAPEKVIGRIRTILKDLGVLPMENWGPGAERRYSLRLQLDGTGIFSEGQGAAPAVILADAYTRLAASLQNFEFLPPGMEMNKRAVLYGGFCFAPDEKLISADELMDHNDKWLSIFTGYANGKDKKEILDAWHSIDHYGGGKDFVSLPYLSIADGKLHDIPRIMAQTMCGITAGRAGVTGREAILQGLCELTERYVMRRMICKKITPPTVPESYIKTNYPASYGTIRRIESKGDFRVFIKDCSLGRGLPVLGIIFTDRNSHSYSVNFGAHPIFEIALEKCLTGLLQGNTFGDPGLLRRFAFSDAGQVPADSKPDLFVNSAGNYPAEFFEETSGDDFMEFNAADGYDNNSMLAYMLDILNAEGCDILARDVSFLGFPCFHMIAAFPGEKPELDRRFFQDLSERRALGRILMNPGAADPAGLEKAVLCMSRPDFDPDISVAAFLHKYSGQAFPWAGMKKDLFISLAYYKMRKFREAYDTIRRYLGSHSRHNEIYLNCLRDYFGILTKDINGEAEIRSYLIKFYPENIVDRVISELKNPDEVFKHYTSTDCFNCSLCPYIKKCTYPALERLYMNLKDRYAANPIDQESIMRYMSLPDKRPAWVVYKEVSE